MLDKQAPQHHRFVGSQSKLGVFSLKAEKLCVICGATEQMHATPQKEANRSQPIHFQENDTDHSPAEAEEATSSPSAQPNQFCEVCFKHVPSSRFCGLKCGHLFCRECTQTHLKI